MGAELVRLDASHALPFTAVFDRICSYAPCSGTGTLARDPEIRWRLVESDLRKHAERQRRVLREMRSNA